MNPKNTWMLVVLAGGLFAFIYFFERHIQPPPPVVARVLPDLNPDDVSSIEIIQPRNQFAIRVERVNGGWQLTKPIAYSVQTGAVEAFLKALSEVSPQRRISAGELQNNKSVNADFGFDSPQATISIQQGDDQRQLELGNITPPGDGIYARVVGIEGIDIINAAFANMVPTNAGQWRDTSFVNLQGLPFVELDVNGAGGQMKFQRDDPGKLWAMVLPIPARANNELIDRLLDQLQALNVRQFVRDDTNADLEPYGLEAPQLSLTFKDKNTNQLLSIQFGKSPTNDTGLAYARTNSSGTIMLVPGGDLKSWSVEPWRFRDPHLYSTPISEQPGAIECYGPDGRTNFIARMAHGVLSVTDGQGETFPAEANTVGISIKFLAEMPVAMWDTNRFANDAVADSALPAMGLAPNPVRRYVLRAAATAGDGPVLAQIDFGSPNTNNPGTICARRSDLPDELSVFAVSAADFDQLPSTAYQLRRHRIWEFDATNVTRLEIQTNSLTRIWEHRRENVWAPMTSGISDNQAKGMYMENVVNNLGFLEAAAWVGPHEPTEEYGFNGNSLKISLTLTKGSQSTNLSVTFGGFLTGADSARFACTQMEDGKNWIFVLSAKEVKDIFDYLPADN
jgi:hypothetical protein